MIREGALHHGRQSGHPISSTSEALAELDLMSLGKPSQAAWLLDDIVQAINCVATEWQAMPDPGQVVWQHQKPPTGRTVQLQQLGHRSCSSCNHGGPQPYQGQK